jgi:hypothetical protein
MNISTKVLKVMGLVVAEKLVERTPDPEIRIWRAVIAMALEDVLITNQNRTESVLKGEAHDWFCNNSDDFKFVCFQAEIEPKYVRMKYLEALERKDIFFTKRQNLNILYTKEYEKLRKAKTREQRRKHTRIINQLRQAIFECSD